jgi:hypothetical protein
MKKFIKQLSIFAAVFGLAAVVGADAFAAVPAGGGAGSAGTGAGSGFLTDLTNALNGSMGTTAGLLVSLVGLYMWIWNQVSWGLIVAIAGALITAFPGIYGNIGKFGKAAFESSITENVNINDGQAAD